MRIFLAGATGVIGTRLVPLLIANGHEVAGLTRSPEKTELVSEMGALPVVGDVYDGDWLAEQVNDFGTELILHELTDLPDDLAEVGAYSWNNAMVRKQGTANLLAAARLAGVDRMLAQSVAWPLGGGPGDAVSDMEQAVLAFGGVVLRYGQFYGPGTYHPDLPPDPPRIHIEEAARQTVAALDAASGILLLVDS
ncbi:MAG TPA: NAD(P)H-binding protein [Acidimicrobiia bacterium]|nr:NAD(P)H-binding protein [Acidimicrobiia bacterium]